VKTEKRVLRERPSLYEFSHMGWKLIGPLAKKCRNFDSLICWAEETSLITRREAITFEAGRRTRNLTAHGHNMGAPAEWALGAVRNVTLALNRLFPDPETSDYDEENRRRREEQLRAFDADLNAMLKIEPDAEGDA